MKNVVMGCLKSNPQNLFLAHLETDIKNFTYNDIHFLNEMVFQDVIWLFIIEKQNPNITDPKTGQPVVAVQFGFKTVFPGKSLPSILGSSVLTFTEEVPPDISGAYNNILSSIKTGIQVVGNLPNNLN